MCRRMKNEGARGRGRERGRNERDRVFIITVIITKKEGEND